MPLYWRNMIRDWKMNRNMPTLNRLKKPNLPGAAVPAAVPGTKEAKKILNRNHR